MSRSESWVEPAGGSPVRVSSAAPDSRPLEKLPLRERKKRQARLALAEAAVRLFGERGYSKTSVDDISDAANYSPSTFFRYFGSKEDVVFYDDDEQLEIFQSLLDASVYEDPWVAVREALLEMARLPGPSFQMARLRIMLTEPVLQGRYVRYLRVWEEAIAERLASRRNVDHKTDIYSQTVAAAVVAAVRAAQRVWFSVGGSIDTLWIQAFDVLEREFSQKTSRVARGRKRARFARAR